MVLIIIVMVLPLVLLIGQAISARQKQKQVEEFQNQKYQICLRNWEARFKILKVNSNSPIVYQHYTDSNGCYAVYIWREGDCLMAFPAKPDSQSSCPSAFMYPEKIKIFKYEIDDCYRTGTKSLGVQTNTDRVDALQHRANYASNDFERLRYAKKAAQATAFASTRIVESDNRETVVVEKDGSTLSFRIDAYEKIIGLFPELLEDR